MKKTTLYIEDELMRKLKERSARQSETNMTRIVNDALRQYLKEPVPAAKRYEYLDKALGCSETFKKMKDPVAFQRKLRSEWD